MSNVSIPYTFTASTTAVASQVNTNFAALANYTNDRNTGSAKWDSLAVLGNGVIDGYLSVGGKSITSIYADVKNYGAKGDGFTDDTASIQTALNSGVKYVYLPAGDYRFTGLTVPTNVKIFGDGAKTTVLSYTPTSGDGLALAASNEYNQIYNLKIYAINASTGTAIESNGTRCADFSMVNCEIEGFKKGFESDCMINFYFGQNRWIGRGKTYAGGVGIGISSGSTTGTMTSNYVSLFETGIDVSCTSTLIERPVLENDGTGILLRHYTTIDTPSFWGCTTIIQTSGNHFALINPVVYDGGGSLVSDIYSVMTLDTSGKQSVVMAQKSFVRAGRSTTQSISSGSDVTVVYNSVTVDRMSEYNSATGVFTAKKPGDYVVSATVYWGTAGVNDSYLIINKNGSQYSIFDAPIVTNQKSVRIHDLVNLDRGETIKIEVHQNTGGSKDIYGDVKYSHIEIHEK